VYEANSRTRISALGSWTNWSNAFVRLPVILTRGNNADINGVLGTDGIVDAIPLQWKDQYGGRIGVERSLHENLTFRGGYAYSNSPVPSSTLTPLTAAITRQTLSTGIGFVLSGWRLDGAYAFDPFAKQGVGASVIRAGEYSNSAIRVSMQSVILTLSKRL
jgi:long-subunit fatty acid transport protein